LVLEDDNMALDVYSGGLAIEPLRESMGKLSYEEEIDSFNESNNLLDKYK
tara:strand:- start:452 stop:601 length:150 start_codon:yes stop_codon:yes gene_type:complete